MTKKTAREPHRRCGGRRYNLNPFSRLAQSWSWRRDMFVPSPLACTIEIINGRPECRGWYPETGPIRPLLGTPLLLFTPVPDEPIGLFPVPMPGALLDPLLIAAAPPVPTPLMSPRAPTAPILVPTPAGPRLTGLPPAAAAIATLNIKTRAAPAPTTFTFLMEFLRFPMGNTPY